MGKKKKLYTVANAHLDTQWNWTIQDTIRDCVKNTLVRNFNLMDKYPNYRMNFEGAFRYKLAKEYYPDLYEKLKKYIADGRWNVAGSTWDAMDANVPSSEALMRQILYGNGYFEKEFGKKSTDIFLTDCFGFRYALPSIEAHMGLNGFSTQKLVWGVGSPMYEEDGSVTKPMPEKREAPHKPRMDLGKWTGPDGKGVAVSLLEGDYTYNFDNGGETRAVNDRDEYLRAIEHNEKFAGVPSRSMYYGTGDYGGSCKESSARMVSEAVDHNGEGKYEVVSASTDQIFNELTKEEYDNLPEYNGELLIPHGSGALTSHTINKRWNRKNELLADSAERAAVISAWLGTGRYPAERLLTAWQTFLWHQFHDDLPGTSIAAAYVFTYNDYVIALNEFASELAGAVGGISSTLDTCVEGTPIVVYNPVSYDRDDIVCAYVDIKTPYVRVFDGLGNEVPAQLSKDGDKTVVKFAAKVKPVSCTVFDVRESETAGIPGGVKIEGRVLENERYIVTVDENGDIASIIDKADNNFELLKSPSHLEIGPDSSTNWPSWELVWSDALKEPVIVGGTPEFEIIDNGAAVVTLQITRTCAGSKFVQRVSLWTGGQRVDVDNTVEWYHRQSNLRAAFPLNVSNPKATFDLGLGAIDSGNTDSFPYYQHVVHQWADLTAEDGSYGVSILNNCKYGMDKPNDNTLRLTLIHTPLGQFAPESGQDWQDMGLNLFTYSICGHKGCRYDTTRQAAQLNQPMIPFTSEKHCGSNKELSFLKVSDNNIVVRCVKKEEKGERIIVRLQETSGKGIENCKVTFADTIKSLTETNGYEDEIAAAEFEGNAFTVSFTPYEVKTFAVELSTALNCCPCKAYAGQTQIELPYTKKATTCNKCRESGEFADGISIPTEIYEENVNAGGISFRLAPATENNAVVCAGQEIAIPDGAKELYILAASADGDRNATFYADGKPVEIKVSDFRENVGSWDMFAFAKTPKIKRDEIAVNYTHTHDKDGDRLYLFAYLFKYKLDVEGVKTVKLPEDSNIIVMAATAADKKETTAPAAFLYDAVEEDNAPVHTVTVINAEGKVISASTAREGKSTLVRTSMYSDGTVFDGWDCDDITAAYDSAAIVGVTDHDVVVKMRTHSLGKDVIMNAPCKASREFNERETGDNALNGNDIDKWCAAGDAEGGDLWLEADAGEVKKVGSWFVMHCGVHESTSWNTRDFRLEYKVNADDEWKVADNVEGNEDSITNREFAPVEGRYFRLFIVNPTQGRNKTARIFMFRVFEA